MPESESRLVWMCKHSAREKWFLSCVVQLYTACVCVCMCAVYTLMHAYIQIVFLANSRRLLQMCIHVCTCASVWCRFVSRLLSYSPIMYVCNVNGMHTYIQTNSFPALYYCMELTVCICMRRSLASSEIESMATRTDAPTTVIMSTSGLFICECAHEIESVRIFLHTFECAGWRSTCSV